MEKNILLIVDMQNDFINGSLPVDGANTAVDNLIDYLSKEGCKRYEWIIPTLDWHPYNHISFDEWPRHCVKNTSGAAIPDRLMKKLSEIVDDKHLRFTYKGYNKEKDAYSIFGMPFAKRYLTLLFNEMPKNSKITVCGIAGDVCVYNTIKDMIELGFKDKIEVLTSAVASIDGGKKLNELIETEHLKKV